ncbi:ATP-binding cassette domain-containing protein [Nocardiopsis sediminis]|uniref:ATP-binding cassette domain-containing protein n=1 Tax=Nocardiopsis sediminis TaxID=1778267 RepID=A0ABV8FYM1_9ACTN
MFLEKVGKRYDRHGPWIISDVTLAVPEAAVVRIEGTNGRGKSTLLKVLAGISRPTAGRVTGRPPTAYVPERFPPDLPFHTVGYLHRVGRIHGLTRRESARRSALWIDRLGLSGHARVPLKRLSKGTSQKVAVAQALMAEPGLLVLDEAWTGLDQAARGSLDDAVLELARSGGRVVFVDHDPARLAGRVTAVHRIVDGSLAPAEPPAAEDPGPRVHIEVDTPHGAALPSGLPGAPSAEPVAPGRTRLTVAERHSDALLRHLLGLRHPPVHIRSLNEGDRPA